MHPAFVCWEFSPVLSHFLLFFNIGFRRASLFFVVENWQNGADFLLYVEKYHPKIWNEHVVVHEEGMPAVFSLIFNCCMK